MYNLSKQVILKGTLRTQRRVLCKKPCSDRIQQVPVVKNGAVVPGNVMKVTLSCDHRVVDGATGSAFLQTFKALLEEPVRLLV